VMKAEQRAWSEEVARYYDRNTGRFLLVGNGRGVHSMHRELWGPGVGSAREASDHINRIVADEIESVPLASRPVIVDFGCGVGGTLYHLAERFPGARLRGITVSRRQVEIAARLARKLGCADRCSVSHGDFHTADLGLEADVIVAVESFAHSESLGAFLANAARHLRPGGRLIIADDFLATDEDTLNVRQRAHVERFRAGWRVPAICTTRRLSEAAVEQGFRVEKMADLTPLTRPGTRARDRVIAAVSPILAGLGLVRFPFYGNMIGGHALQVGLREGFLVYKLLILEKADRGVSRGAAGAYDARASSRASVSDP